MHFSSPHPYKMNKELFLIQLFINLLSAILDRCQRHLGKLKKKSELIGRGGFYRHPVLHTAVCNGAMNKYEICLQQTTQWTFLAQNVVIPCRQQCYERSAILAPVQWTPLQYWQRRNELLHNIGNCMMMPGWWCCCSLQATELWTLRNTGNGTNELLCNIGNGAMNSGNEYWQQHEDACSHARPCWDGRIFLKTFALLSLIKAFRMNLFISRIHLHCIKSHFQKYFSEANSVFKTHGHTFIDIRTRKA